MQHKTVSFICKFYLQQLCATKMNTIAGQLRAFWIEGNPEWILGLMSENILLHITNVPIYI